MDASPVPASFRDPSGFVFLENGQPYRQVHTSYRADYDLLMGSGLYNSLVSQGLLIRHDERAGSVPTGAYKVLKPELVPFISYPYEWSFGQLKDAALATLAIQKQALGKGMWLKDASAYNIQFVAGRPLLIDTLSFEGYEEGTPWVAYRQFCQHFLAPLALMAHIDLSLGSLSREYIDGIPLEVAARLLPGRTKFSLGLATHLHLHARSQVRHAGKPGTGREFRLPRPQLEALISNLEATIRSLRMPRQKTVWGDYYENTNYTAESLAHKEELVASWIRLSHPASVWDAGANDGHFSRLASGKGIFTIASDIDPVAVNRAYLDAGERNDDSLLPLLIDLTNPSPAIGWMNQERESFLDRVQVDMAFCLALIHHLAIANNLPLGYCAKFFHGHAKELVIEFVPKEDSNAMRLLAARKDIFTEYTSAGFEAAFTQYFKIKEKVEVRESRRTLYWMVAK